MTDPRPRPGLTNKGWMESGILKGLPPKFSTSGVTTTGNPLPKVDPIETVTGPQFNAGAVNAGDPKGYTWNPNPGGGITGGSGAPAGTGTNNTNRWARIGAKVNDIAPFVSNIVNSFRTPPMPKKGMYDRYTPLQKVNLQDQRNQVANTFAAANRATERNIDSNSAEAIKAFNRGQEISQMSAINEKEMNTNVGISNQQAAMDQQIGVMNTAKENKFKDELVERQVAKQREASANIANAGDKYVMLQNEKQKAKTEIAKANVLAGVYDKSGVLDRARAEMKKKGLPDPLGKDYQDVTGAYGGIMKGLPSKRLC